MSNDWAMRVEQARKKLPLPTLMSQHGHHCEGKKFRKCPFCDHKDSAGFFDVADGVMFKCHNTACKSGTQGKGEAWDEVGFLAYQLNISRKDACIVLMKEAGVWREDRLPPSGDAGEGGEETEAAAAGGREAGTGTKAGFHPARRDKRRQRRGSSAPDPGGGSRSASEPDAVRCGTKRAPGTALVQRPHRGQAARTAAWGGACLRTRRTGLRADPRRSGRCAGFMRGSP